MNTEYKLPSDLTTIKAHARRLGVSYDTMRLWCWYHRIQPTMHFGRTSIYRLKDLELYKPMKTRKATV